MSATRLYGIVWRWHFAAGLLACPIVFVIALTGALYAFQPELEPLLADEVVVTPREQRASVEAIVAAAAPRCTPSGFVLPSRDDRAAMVYCLEGTRHLVYVDPYRATVLGERAEGSTFFEVVFGLHWDLLLGDPGRLVIEWASSWTLLLLISGAILWWPRGKRRGGGVWWPRRGLGARQTLRDLHAVLGAYVVPVLLAITASGLMWTLLAGQRRWHPLTEDAVHETWDHPPASTAIAGAPRIGFDAALVAAGIDRAGSDRLAIYGMPPATPASPYTFLAYDDRAERPWHAFSVWVDAYAGTRLARLAWDDRSAAGKLDSTLYSIHVGAILHLPGRILACAAALVLAALCVTGPWMWWKRRPAGRLGAPPRAARTPWLLFGVLAGVGWLLPTVGITLLVVLALEAAWWLVSRMRAATTTALGVAIVLLASDARADDAPPIETFDADGDGDIDAADRAILDAAEQVEIVDESDATKLRASARAVQVIETARDRERTADLGEVLSRAEGIQVRREGGLGSATRFSLDGMYDDQIRFFLDGVPLAFAGWGLGVANVPIAFVQRVDVHRGVVPLSLGADALGGAVDLITDPSWVNRAAASYQTGSFGTHRATASARARDADSGLALGLTLFVDRATNDYPVEVEVPDEVGHLHTVRVPRFHDGYTAAGGSVEAGVVERGLVERALVRVWATDYAKELQHNVVMTVPYGEATYGEAARGATLDVQLAPGAWRARVLAGVARRHLDFRDTAEVVYDWYGEPIRDRPMAGELGSGTATDRRIRETGVFARLSLERALGEHHALRAMIAPTAALRGGTDFLDPNPTGRDPLSARKDLVQLVSGVEHELRLGRVQNIGFVKHYAMWTDAEDVLAGFTFMPIEQRAQQLGIGDGARIRLSPRVSIAASYEHATRLPSVDEIFGDGLLVQQNLELAPERSHNANASVRYAAEGRLGALIADATAFARVADQLIVLTGDDRYFKYQNVYAARITGVSSSAAWTAPRDRASLEGSLTVQDLRNTSSEGTFGAFEGDRVPNRPWLFGALGGTVRTRDLVRAGDELALFASSRYVHAFYRSWESAGLKQFKQVVPSQLVHGVGITYAARGVTPVVTTVELQNVTDARAYDTFGVQRPGRALFVKIAAEI